MGFVTAPPFGGRWLAASYDGAMKTRTVRIPLDLVEQLQADAAQRGVSLSVALEERLRGAPVRASSPTATAALPVVRAGHLVARAEHALASDPPDVAAARALVLKARRAIAGALLAVHAAYDRELNETVERLGDTWGEA